MLGNDEQINDREGFEVVIHEEQIRIVARGQTLAFRFECAVDHSRAELAFLALEFELLVARWAEEISEWTIVREGRDSCVAAVWAVRPSAYPSFSPCAGALRAAGIGGLGFFEAEFHTSSVTEVG